MAYLALVSLLDELVQPSYTLAAQIRPLPTPKVVLKLDPRKIEKEDLVNCLGWKSQFDRGIQSHHLLLRCIKN